MNSVFKEFLNYSYSLIPFKKFPVVIPPVDMILILDLSLFIFFPEFSFL